MTVSSRRLIRWIAVITALIVVTLACWQDPVYTHEGVKVTNGHDGAGSVGGRPWPADQPGVAAR